MNNNCCQPYDKNLADLYDEIADKVRDSGLVMQAAGGVITIVHPKTQQEEGIYCECQYMAGLGDHPGVKGDPNAHCKCIGMN